MGEKVKKGLKKVSAGAKALAIFLWTMKDMGKFIAFAIEIWAMIVIVKFAQYNDWSKEILTALMPGIIALFQTVAIIIGASLGVTKIVETVVSHLDQKKQTSTQK